MGKKWDYNVPGIDVWQECLRVLKPGGTALIFAGSRTQHRMAVNVEDAGWILKDCIMWIYATGFPKATDISKQLDKGHKRKITGYKKNEKDFRDLGKNTKKQHGLDKLGVGVSCERQDIPITEPTTPEVKLWNGWKSHGLKPAYEIVICAEKPLDFLEQRSIIIDKFNKLTSQLCLLLSVKTAKKLIKNRPPGQELASIAQWSAEKSTSIKDDLLGQMDMCQLDEMVRIVLNTVILWRNSLIELWNTTNKFIIKTEIDKTIDWKTLSLCLSESTPQNIIRAEIKQPGLWLNASPVAKILNAVSKSINAIQELSVAENVISSRLIKSQGVAGKTLSPNYGPILVAMKPNEGSYAENALKYGVSGLNIDGGRIEHKEDLSVKRDGHKLDTNKQGWGFKAVDRGNEGRFPANIILECNCDKVITNPTETKEPEEVKGGIWQKSQGKLADRTYKGGSQIHTNPDCPCYMLDAQSGESKSSNAVRKNKQRETMMLYGHYDSCKTQGFNDKGGASRFFYCAKASKAERNNFECDDTYTLKDNVPQNNINEIKKILAS